MNAVLKLLSNLRSRGVEIWSDGDELYYKDRTGSLDPSEVGELRQHKREIQALLARVGSKKPASPPPIPPAPEAERREMSFAQKRLWFLAEGQGASEAYHNTLDLRLQGPLNEEALCRALDRLVERHETLRTRFATLEATQVQIISPPETGFPLSRLDLTGEEGAEQRLQDVIEQEARAPFDLEQGPLARAQLIRLATQDHALLITLHHVNSDGWSMGVLARELGALYSAFSEGKPDPLEPLRLQYADYAAWQRRWMSAETLAEHATYWREALTGAPLELELPTDRKYPAHQSYVGSTVDLELEAAATSKLKALSRQHGTTLFMTVLAAWALVLARLSGQDEVVIGTPTANRTRTELEGLIGFFVNTLALRIDLRGNPTVEELLQRTRTVCLGAQEHQDMPFEQIVEILNPPRNPARSPIFQVMLAWHNNRIERLELRGLIVTEIEPRASAAKFDLTLELAEANDRIAGLLTYSTALFDAITADRYVAYLRRTLSEMASDPQQNVATLDFLPPEERRQLLIGWNQTSTPYPRNRCIHELFEEQVRRTPGALAVLHGNSVLTYTALNRKANRLARYLLGQGTRPGECVPIVMPRSVQMLIAQLAVLKSGCTYVPIDADAPRERREFMIRDCGALRVLSAGAVDPTPGLDTVQWIDTSALESELAWLPSENLQRQHPNPPPAYVMYTSGSTGTPKGVMVPHWAVNRLVINTNYIRIGPSDCVAHDSNPAFDASTFEIWGALLNGARLLVVPQPILLEPALFAGLLQQHAVTVLWLTTGLFTQYAQPLSSVFSQLRYVIFGGDVADPAAVRRVLLNSPPGHLLNAYGPTECTTFSTMYLISDRDRDTQSLPIGRPIANTRVYVLDKHGGLAPTGVFGEIQIGGDGVALGYLNRPDLTNERFIADPFAPTSSSPPHSDMPPKLYRTGDIGRWHREGVIEYLGRNDNQIKLRGFRIELGEIEARLLSDGRIKEAVVIARQDTPGEKRLVAYIVPADPADSQSLTAEKLRAQLKSALPEYMIPSAFVTLERLPLTPNGKWDRRALPAPEDGASASRTYEPPQGELEQLLSTIWGDLLRLERVGRQDHFFELGGHSLLIVKMLDRLRRAGLSATVREVFDNPTLTDLAAALSGTTAGQQEIPPNRIPPGTDSITPDMLSLLSLEQHHIDHIIASIPGGAPNIQDIYPLAPLQEGILFHHLLHQQGEDTYARSVLLELSSRQHVDQLIAALQFVIERHDILRTAILWERLPRPVQIVCRTAKLPVEFLSPDPDRETLAQLKEWVTPERQRLDLRQAPLIRVLVAPARATTHYYALLQTHHLVCDNESIDLLVSEVTSHLRASTHELPPPAPYRNHVAQSLAYANAHDAEAFFRQKLGDVHEPTAPFGLLNVQTSSHRIEDHREVLDEALSKSIRLKARQLGVTTATLFHAAWALVVSHTSGRDDVVFGSVLLGRLQSNAGAERILGMFINTLPLRLPLQGLSTKDLVERTQRELVDLLGHEQASLAVAQRCSGLTGSVPLFTTLLNYRHSLSHPEADWSSAPGVTLLSSEGRTNYPIVLSVDELDTGFGLEVEADRGIDPSRLVGYVRTALQRLLRALTEAPQTPALSLSILPDCEREQLITLFNASSQPVAPRNRLIHTLFEEQVEKTPDALALVCENHSLTFSQLNQRANQLGRYLRNRGIGPDCLVGLCTGRTPEAVMGLLGILKAGGAYVPLDPAYPTERLVYLLTDAAPAFVLTQQHLRDRLPPTPAQIITLDDHWSSPTQADGANLDPLAIGLSPQHLAYAIYTSGSTGQPKGVLVEHRNVVNHWSALESLYRTPVDCRRIAVNAPFTFDASVQQLVQLLSGCTLYLIPQSLRLEPLGLLNFLRQHQIQGIDCTPSQLSTWIGAGLLDGTPHPLNTVLVGGEAIDASLWNTLREAPDITFHNVYGPTECTVDSTAASLQGPHTSAHIGRPLANTRIYILNSRGEPAPIGVVGEIFIGGAGVTRGYLNRPELTADRFPKDPFGTEPTARLYRTGDLGRWRPDGTIEYLGRNDDQVKVRGFRIELGEIEAHLRTHIQVKEGVVLAREDSPGEKRLVAYVVPTTTDLSIGSLRTHLQASLPDHMIPSAFVILERFPLTSSGKLNRRELPVPEQATSGSRTHEPPAGDVEETLAEIWRDLLRLERIGRHNNFFELGGHSLHAMRLIVKVAERLQLSIPVMTVFQQPTIQKLASALETIRKSSAPEAKRQKDLAHAPPSHPHLPHAPLSFSQLAHWHLYALHERPAIRQLASATRLCGELDVSLLQKSLNTLVHRHDALRTQIICTNGIPEQRINSEIACDIDLIDLSSLPPTRQAIEIQRLIDNLILAPVDVAHDPLFAVSLLKIHDQEHILIFAAEHLICDAASMRILLHELLTTYTRSIRGDPTRFPEIGMQLSEFATAQSRSLTSWLDQHGPYWKQHFANAQRTRFPTEEGTQHQSGWGSAQITFGAELTSQLRDWCRSRRTTVPVAVLTAYVGLVARWCAQPELTILYATDGRFLPEVQNTVGYFASTLYLRFHMHETQRIEDLLTKVSTELLSAYEHADAGYTESQLPRPDFTQSTAFNWIPQPGRPDGSDPDSPSGSLECHRIPFTHPMLNTLDRDAEPMIELAETHDDILGTIMFPRNRFSDSSMERFGRNLLVFTRALLTRAEQKVREIPLS